MSDLWPRFGGKPQHLFIFQRDTASLRFASAQKNVVIGDHTYTAATIERDGIRQTAERAKDAMKIKMAYSTSPVAPPEGYPSTQALGNWWRPYIPGSPVKVLCLDRDRNGIDPPRLVWTGWVQGAPEFTDAELTLTCDPNYPAAEAGNLGPKWQRGCWKLPYSTGPRGCNLDPDDFAIETTDLAVSGLTVTSDDFDGTPFTLAGGEFIFERTLLGETIEERLPVIGHSGSTITLLHGAPDLADVTEAVVLPTCQQNWEACAARDNTLNFGGTVYKPSRDPAQVSMSWG